MSIDAITQFVFLRDAPVLVDLALVLGSPSISNIEPAIALYKEGLTQQLVISGHGPAATSNPEWRVYSDHALAAGIPERHILIEPNARNTLENFTFSKALIDREIGWKTVSRIAICCKPLHARRAYMTARKQIPGHVELLVIPPTNHADIQPSNWQKTERGRTRVMGELSRIAEYTLKGDISIE